MLSILLCHQSRAEAVQWDDLSYSIAGRGVRWQFHTFYSSCVRLIRMDLFVAATSKWNKGDYMRSTRAAYELRITSLLLTFLIWARQELFACSIWAWRHLLRVSKHICRKLNFHEVIWGGLKFSTVSQMLKTFHDVRNKKNQQRYSFCLYNYFINMLSGFYF